MAALPDAAQVPRAEASPPSYDVALSDRARVLAGLRPERPDKAARTLSRREWTAWEAEANAEWSQEQAARVGPISLWQRDHLAPFVAGTRTLVYPFSGPDVLNAILLFPACPRYVLFGLEHVGSLPDPELLPPERLARLLDEIHGATADLFVRNYFITSHMSRDTQAQELHGILPILVVFLARLDARLVSVRRMEVAPDGSLRAPSADPADARRAAPAVEVVFARPGREPQTLVYFRAQAEDAAVGSRPGVLPFLDREAPFLTFLKSASYLLHGSQFSQMRRLLLHDSQLILQDDSGIPFRFLPSPPWSVTLFGRYQKPVRDFNYGYQADLARAYDSGKVHPLGFSFGYHWEAGSSTLMLAVRDAAPAVESR